MAANLKFRHDIEKWADRLNARIGEVLQGVTTALHGRLAEATPYLTGRARASWNISVDQADTNPAPELPVPISDPLNPTPAELASANAFYDAIYESKHATILPQSARVVVISNNVPYIELLNAGYSRQAPAGFFEATVAGMERLVQQQAARRT